MVRPWSSLQLCTLTFRRDRLQTPKHRHTKAMRAPLSPSSSLQLCTRTFRRDKLQTPKHRDTKAVRAPLSPSLSLLLCCGDELQTSKQGPSLPFVAVNVVVVVELCRCVAPVVVAALQTFCQTPFAVNAQPSWNQGRSCRFVGVIIVVVVLRRRRCRAHFQTLFLLLWWL